MTTILPLDFSVDLLRAILWQYNDATRLQSLLQSKQDWYNENQRDFWENWVRDVFDLRTANEFGLTVWAIILGMPLFLETEDEPDKDIWGFGEYRENFNNGNFASSGGVGLTLEQKRIVLRLRYFQLTTRATVPEINAFFAYLFSDLGRAYVADGLDMTALYIFEFDISSPLKMVLTEFDLLPRPAGVRIDYVIAGEAQGWGFGRYRENFNNGNFYHA